MLEAIKKITPDDYDIYSFLPTGDSKIYIEVNKYANDDERIDFSELGSCYHIILFKETDDNSVHSLDMFDGILIHPMTYISNMISYGWYGVVCKKTTNSLKFANSLLDTLKNID